MSHARVIDPAAPASAADLRRARRDRGLTVGDVARGADVDLRVVSRAERGIEPREANAKRIADFWGVAVSDLWPEPNPQNDPAALVAPGATTDVHQEDDSAHER
jgi:transcriptional regulator with XRE-family HTH domain